MEHCNGLPTPTNVEEPLGTDVNGSEAKRDWPNSYAFVIGMMLYLSSDTRPDKRQLLMSSHTCGFQDFADQSSLTKLKCTIIQCIDINALELRH